MLAPYWVLFVLLCPHFHQFDSQQLFKIIYEILVKLKPFVLKHCKKASHYTDVSTILGPIYLLCPHFYQFDSQQPFKIIYEFLIKLKPFVLKHCKKASHNTGVSTILGPLCFIVSSFSSIWFAAAFQNHLWIFNKIITFCSKALQKIITWHWCKHHIRSNLFYCVLIFINLIRNSLSKSLMNF